MKNNLQAVLLFLIIVFCFCGGANLLVNIILNLLGW